MSKITINDPYASNGDALTKVSSPQMKVLSGKNNVTKAKKHFYIESYGCQMNFSDSEIVASILNQEGYELTEKNGKSQIDFSKHLLNQRKSRKNCEKKTGIT